MCPLRRCHNAACPNLLLPLTAMPITAATKLAIARRASGAKSVNMTTAARKVNNAVHVVAASVADSTALVPASDPRQRRPARRSGQLPKQPQQQRDPNDPVPVGEDGMQRIAKLLAWRGLCSRREAEKLIEHGNVSPLTAWLFATRSALLNPMPILP